MKTYKVYPYDMPEYLLYVAAKSPNEAAGIYFLKMQINKTLIVETFTNAEYKIRPRDIEGLYPEISKLLASASSDGVDTEEIQLLIRKTHEYQTTANRLVAGLLSKIKFLAVVVILSLSAMFCDDVPSYASWAGFILLAILGYLVYMNYDKLMRARSTILVHAGGCWGNYN